MVILEFVETEKERGRDREVLPISQKERNYEISDPNLKSVDDFKGFPMISFEFQNNSE